MFNNFKKLIIQVSRWNHKYNKEFQSRLNMKTNYKTQWRKIGNKLYKEPPVYLHTQFINLLNMKK